MNNFYYYNPTKLIFGKNSIDQLDIYLNKDIKKILLHYGGETIKRLGIYEDVVNICKKRDIEIIELSNVSPNPKVDLVREGINICKENNIDFVLAAGGGSVIDSAKAIALGVYIEEDIWDRFLNQKPLEKALPVGVVLTIPASGSETSNATILNNEETKEKLGFEDDYLRPQFALLDPEYTMTLPKRQTFAGVVDILSHIFERYFTNTENVELTDNLCEAAIKTVINNAYKLLEDEKDYNARAEIMLSGTIAHSGILGLGRQEDWASHRIGHEITALYGTTHGITLSIVLPAWMKYVYKKNIDRFKRFGVNIFNIDDKNLSDEEIALMSIEKLIEFFKDISVSVSLKEEGIDDKNIELMAEKCTKSGPVGRFVKIHKEDAINILNIAK